MKVRRPDTDCGGQHLQHRFNDREKGYMGGGSGEEIDY